MGFLMRYQIPLIFFLFLSTIKIWERLDTLLIFQIIFFTIFSYIHIGDSEYNNCMYSPQPVCLDPMTKCQTDLEKC